MGFGFEEFPHQICWLLPLLRVVRERQHWPSPVPGVQPAGSEERLLPLLILFFFWWKGGSGRYQSSSLTHPSTRILLVATQTVP